jgi:hypothetical protein
MTTGKLTFDEGTQTNVATNTITEDAVTKHINRTVLNNSSGTELGTSGNPIKVDGSGATQPVSGTVTANAGTGTFGVSGTVTANAGTGTFTVDGSGVTQPVQGTQPASSSSRKFLETGGLHGFTYIGTRTVQAGSTNTTINVTSTTSTPEILVGDYIKLYNGIGGPTSNPTEYVVSKTSTSFTVSSPYTGTVSTGQSLDIYRPNLITVDSNNQLKVGGSVNINSSVGYPLIDYNDGGGNASLPVTLYDPIINSQIGIDSNPLVIKGGGIPTPTSIQQFEINATNGWSYKGLFTAGAGSGGDTIFNASTIFRVGDLVKVISGSSTDKFTYISTLNSGFFNLYSNIGFFTTGDTFEIWRKDVVGVDSEHNLQTTAMVTNIGEALKNLTRLIAKPVWLSQASGEVRTSTVVSSGSLSAVTTVTTVTTVSAVTTLNQIAGFDAKQTKLYDASRTTWGTNIRGRIT